MERSWGLMEERSYHLTESHGGKGNSEDDGRTHLYLFRVAIFINVSFRGFK